MYFANKIILLDISHKIRNAIFWECNYVRITLELNATRVKILNSYRIFEHSIPHNIINENLNQNAQNIKYHCHCVLNFVHYISRVSKYMLKKQTILWLLTLFLFHVNDSNIYYNYHHILGCLVHSNSKCNKLDLY